MKELFANLEIGMVGLLFFFTFFVVVAVWSYMPRNRKRIEAYKNIPFEGTSDE